MARPTEAAPGTVITTGVAASYDSDVVNKSLQILASNGVSGDFTGGDAGNTLQVVIEYSIADFS